MATRSSGGSGMVYGMILFVFVSVIFLALTILFYSKYVGVEKELKTEQAKLKTIINRSEMGEAAYGLLAEQAKKSRRTVFGQLLGNYQKIALAATGIDKVDTLQILAKLESAGVAEGQNAASLLQENAALVSSMQSELDSWATGDKERREELSDVATQYKEIVEEHDALTQRRKNEIDVNRKEFEAFEDQANRDRQDLEGMVRTIKSDASTEKSRLTGEVSGLKTDLRRMEARARDLEGQLGKSSITAPDMSNEIDGRVVSVVPEDNMVIVDLGRKDRLILGLRFELFDANTGVRRDTNYGSNGELARGKATIEVHKIYETTALCQIIRQTRGQMVLTGDVIANIAYNSQRKFKFFVFGDYDLNFDGKSDPGDFDLVVSMIERWGGEAIDNVSVMPADTDFLVLGLPPARPRSLSMDESDPETIRRYQEGMKSCDDYYKLVDMAKSLSVPVLNQNRFLYLIGYTNQ